MNTHLLLMICIAALVIWVGIRLFRPRTDYQPLLTEPDDPLMQDAFAQARATLEQFRTLLGAPHKHALVKLRFSSDSEQVEHIWADVLAQPVADELEISIATAPVSHKGRFERRCTCRLDEIEDWQLTDMQDKIHGGFSQRAMFAIARRDGLTLPRSLQALEKHYASQG
ncbi:DUF2314 domain-containing protein [Uliginosibacterium gangwonense]|uniref:DUF2314 domain-containing protein n=1 Tax=Uliginosibacterium gangwonense TaxID=392736 RepID=UPI000368935D|nr:DUF2314 domain-containing protein [Uliginosibacterium gangwonense]